MAHPPLEDPSPPSPPAGGERSAWKVLGHALAPRATRAQVIAGVLCAVLGFAMVTQLRHTARADYSGLRESELIELLDQLTRRTGELTAQNLALEAQREELESARGADQAAAEAASERLRVQGILSGTLPAEGPGVVLTVYDPTGRVTASSLYHVIEEMRNAGAEAMSVGDIRVTASTWVADGVQEGEGVIEVDGRPVFAPYEFRAIGNPETIEVALRIPGGALASIRNAGGSETLERMTTLSVSAVATPPPFQFASPVPEP